MSTDDTWWKDSFFYHLYPLGYCGCPHTNEHVGDPVHRIERIHELWPHLQELGVDALLLGPLFESSSHGYDTVDFFSIDRRLGDWNSLRTVCAEAHRRNIRIVLDGVFNHVGRNFWAFRDLQQKLAGSEYRSWFSGVRFDQRSPQNDPFSYDAWEGHFELVKLALSDAGVRKHLFDAIRRWVQELQIDGVRLDVAYSLDRDFLRDLTRFCHTLDRPLALIGEMIHGDYRQWVGEGKLDSGTDYECYKGLWSSHVDANYFEIAYSFNRLFGRDGNYRDLSLYNFVDNHDVSRVASVVHDASHLYPLHILLFTMPGFPSVYYGSEWGIAGTKGKGSDWNLRPDADSLRNAARSAHPELANTIRKLAAIRREGAALRHGDYTQLHVDHKQFAFARRTQADEILVAVNSASQPASVELRATGSGVYRDLLNPGRSYTPRNGRLRIDALDPTWGSILRSTPR